MDFTSSSMLPIIYLLLFLMISSISTPTTFSLTQEIASPFPYTIAKPNCKDRCGDVSIPFPFGTREGCYLDKEFYINCSSSLPFIRHGNIIVTSISLEGQLRVLQSVGNHCYINGLGSTDYSSRINIGPPFTFNSTANKFTAIGCNTNATVKGGSKHGSYTTGCFSICQKREFYNSCEGIGCCQISIPYGTREIIVSISSIGSYPNTNNGSCSYAFVAEEDAFQLDVYNLTNLATFPSLPVVVDWVVAYENCKAAQQKANSYACKENSVCDDPVGAQGYRCRCKEGYQGNPYLGCQDIDECGDSTLYNCAKYSTCVNTIGNYTCNCTQGYHGDGRTDGGCIANAAIADKNYWPIIAGAGVSTATGTLLGFFFCLYFELARKKANRLREELYRKNGGLLLEQKQRVGTRAPRIFTIEELQQATNSFDESQIVGRGGYGTVFKGELMDNKIVAIKKSRVVDQQQNEQFINELFVLSQINNVNVVELVGCCMETEVPLLVYEYINNGTLFEHLRHNIKASKLSWNIRLRIASQVAGVLSYLHHVVSPPIIHRDIKSANILLDQSYTAKLSDFGISKLVPVNEDQVSTIVQGTHGYLDPEYMQTGLLTEKSDVYSFGIVLIELLTGKKVFEPQRSEKERFLPIHFLMSLRQDHLDQVFDNNIYCDDNIHQLKEVAKIAKTCISVKGEDRPSMKDVARELEALGMNSQQFSSVQIFEIDSTNSETLLEFQSKIYGSGDDTTFSDQYPVCNTTTEQPLIAIAGGR